MGVRYCVYKNDKRRETEGFTDAGSVIAYLANHEPPHKVIDNDYKALIDCDLSNSEVTVTSIEVPNGITSSYSESAANIIKKPFSETIQLLNALLSLDKPHSISAKCINENHRDSQGKWRNLNLEKVEETLLKIKEQLNLSSPFTFFSRDKEREQLRVAFTIVNQIKNSHAIYEAAFTITGTVP